MVKTPYDQTLGQITQQDREYACDLLEELEVKPGSHAQRELVAQWLRKVRYEAVMADRKRR